MYKRQAVDDGAEGINGAAKSTQNLVEDIVNISDKMNENKVIAQTLQKSCLLYTSCLYRRQHLRPCDPHLFNQPWQHAGQQNQPACVQAGQGGNAV